MREEVVGRAMTLHQIESISNYLMIISSLQFCLPFFLFGICLLFFGGYNIYCDRLALGFALVGLGTLIGLSSFVLLGGLL
jgi:hypothetical protein